MPCVWEQTVSWSARVDCVPLRSEGKLLLNEEAQGQHWNYSRLTGCERDIWGLNFLQVYGNVLLPNQFCGSPNFLSGSSLPRSETFQPGKLMTCLHLVLSLVMHGALPWNLVYFHTVVRMGGACSMYGGEVSCIQGFDGETWGKETTWKTQA